MLEAMRQQYEDFKLLADIEAIGSPESPPPPPPRLMPSPPPRRGAVFYATEKQSLPNAIEVELLSTLVVAVSGVHVAANLMRAVDAEASNVEALGVAWTPPTIGALNPSGDLRLKYLAIFQLAVDSAELVRTAHLLKLQPLAVHAYLRMLVGSKPKLVGPKRDSKGNTSPRYIAALPEIAVYLNVRKPTAILDALMKEEETFSSPSSVSEVIERWEAAEVAKEVAEGERATAIGEKRKAESAAEKHAAKLAKTVTDRKEERKANTTKVKERVKARLPALRKEAARRHDAEAEAKYAHAKELRAAAHAEKRDWKELAEREQDLAQARLFENTALKEQVDELKQEVEELHECADDDTAAAHADAWAMVQAMPTWRAARIKGRGGGRMYEYDHRVTIYSMIANGTPLSAIGPNIVNVVRRTAPWLDPQTPSPRMLTECRFELRMIEESLAARRVASAYAIRLLGFDETTKNGNPSITSNVIIEPTRGAKLEPVILRGAYCSAGGTSELIAAAIESKCFDRLRTFLRRWKAQFLEMYPGETWTGPEANDLSMARLAGGGGLQSDTCNTAEKAKTILTEMIAQQAKTKLGSDAWDAMTDEEQSTATRVHKLDCYQHLRNIFLREMSSAQSKHVADELKPHLDAFSSWERMTTDYTQLLRAAYKEFHHGNKYAAAHPAHPTTSPGARGTRWPARQANALPYEDPCAHPERPPFTPPIPAIPHVPSCD